MKKLSAEHLIQLHEFVVNETGGYSGIRNRKDLESVISSIEYPINRDKVRSIVHICAQLFRLIIQKHPFLDGNKRTALAAVLALLERNRYKLKSTDKDIENFTFKIAKGEIFELDEIEYWIFSRLKKVSKSGEEL
ncbi:MAG: type II toxin-antitoxin system death-on-curing family toxin [Candidatus Nanoarchaeia archaeon]|jgi:death-on-curing protein